MSDAHGMSDEATTLLALIERIVRECPRRQPTSADERRAQELVAAVLEAEGLGTAFHEFRFNDNLYANLALHFGLAVAGTAVSGVLPLLGAALQGTAAASYLAESMRRGYFLRRLFPFRPSQNLVATLPADGEPALRIVVLAHADAAFTGWLFDPRLVARLAGSHDGPLAFLRRSNAVAIRSQAALAVASLARAVLGPVAWPLRPLEGLLVLPSLIGFVLALQVVLRNEIVPGAADNLSGVAGLVGLVRRLVVRRRRDVEYVFVVTGCEEASLGGADALARDRRSTWDPRRTVVVALDTLSNGALRYIHTEGEVVRLPVPGWLCETVDAVATSEARFRDVTGFEVPVGGSDAAAFLAHGYDAVCLTCIDPVRGAADHYHLPSDTPEHLDGNQIVACIDFAERLVEAIAARRIS